MLVPMLVSSAFVLAVVILCFARPNAGRIFLGFFYLAMALGVNGSFTFGNPQAYLDYANEALIPFYGKVFIFVLNLVSPLVFGLLLMVFEITMALLLLYKQKFVKAGLVGTMLFLIAMIPLSWLQVPWLGLVIAKFHLLKQEFDKPFLALLRLRPNPDNHIA